MTNSSTRTCTEAPNRAPSLASAKAAAVTRYRSLGGTISHSWTRRSIPEEGAARGTSAPSEKRCALPKHQRPPRQPGLYPCGCLPCTTPAASQGYAASGAKADLRGIPRGRQTCRTRRAPAMLFLVARRNSDAVPTVHHRDLERRSTHPDARRGHALTGILAAPLPCWRKRGVLTENRARLLPSQTPPNRCRARPLG